MNPKCIFSSFEGAKEDPYIKENWNSSGSTGWH
jgi:hypothetical protein